MAPSPLPGLWDPLVFFTAQFLIKKKGALVKDYFALPGLLFPMNTYTTET
jgi:hypothetical protein